MFPEESAEPSDTRFPEQSETIYQECKNVKLTTGIKEAGNAQARLVPACLAGDLDIVRMLVESKRVSLSRDCSRQDVTIEKGQDSTACTPLSAAIKSKNLELVRYLVEKGADVNTVDDCGVSALITACLERDTEIVLILFDGGADVNYRVPEKELLEQSGWTALHACAFTGNEDLFLRLAGPGAASCHTRSTAGETPLALAALNGHANFLLTVIDDVGLPCFNDGHKADLLELLGTYNWIMKRPNKCLECLRCAMELRHPKGKPKLLKVAPSRKEAAYSNSAVETQTMEELENLKPTDSFALGMECILIRERILGRWNYQTCCIIERCFKHCFSQNRFLTIADLCFRILENLSDRSPFGVYPGHPYCYTLKIYNELLTILYFHRGTDAKPGPVKFWHVLTVLRRAVFDFKRGEQQQPHTTDEKVIRQTLLALILNIFFILFSLAWNSLEEKEIATAELTAFVRLGYRGVLGKTLLHMACDAETAMCISHNYVDKFCRFPTCPEMLKVLVTAGCDVNAEDDARQTALQVACTQNGDIADIIAFLQWTPSGKDLKDTHPEETPAVTDEVTQVDHEIETLQDKLLQACLLRNRSLVRHLVSVKRLSPDFEKEYPTGFQGDPKDSILSPVTAAVLGNDMQIVEFLVKRGASVNNANGYYSPLKAAIIIQSAPLVQYLLRVGADVNALEKDSSAVLLCASVKGSVEIAAMLLDSGADPNFSFQKVQFDRTGWTPLHNCGVTGNVEMFQLLLQYGAKIKRLKLGETPLMIAAVHGRENLVYYIIDNPELFSRADRANALELLGVYYWESNSRNNCMDYWKKAFKIRGAPGQPRIHKKHPDQTVAVYEDAYELETVEEIEDLYLEANLDEFVDIQCMLAAERILGPHSRYTCKFIKMGIKEQVMYSSYHQALELSFHCLSNLSDLCPFQGPGDAVHLYAMFILHIIRRGQDKERKPLAVTLNQTVKALLMAVSDFRRGDATPGISRSKMFLTLRQTLLKVILNLIYLVLRKVFQGAPDPEREEAWKQVTTVVGSGLRGQHGETLLHLACDEQTYDLEIPSELEQLQEYDSEEDKKLRCPFPVEPIVVLLLIRAGSDASARNEAGQTALQVARNQRGNHIEMIKILEEASQIQL